MTYYFQNGKMCIQFLKVFELKQFTAMLNGYLKSFDPFYSQFLSLEGLLSFDRLLSFKEFCSLKIFCSFLCFFSFLRLLSLESLFSFEMILSFTGVLSFMSDYLRPHFSLFGFGFFVLCYLILLALQILSSVSAIYVKDYRQPI